MGFMEPGLNSDLEVDGQPFHVQTEDWGWENPFIVTKIFSQGAVLKSIKTPYKEVLSSPLFDDRSIGQALRTQHKKILDRLISGQF